MQSKPRTFIKNTFGLIALYMFYKFLSLFGNGEQVSELAIKYPKFYVWLFLFSIASYFILLATEKSKNTISVNVEKKPSYLRTTTLAIYIPVSVLVFFLLHSNNIGFDVVDSLILSFVLTTIFTVIIITPTAIFNYIVSLGGTAK